LLDVAVVVLRVLVEDEAADVVHGELAAGPDLGDVEGVEAEFVWVCFFGLHDLDFGGPFDFLAGFDGFPELLLGVVGVLAGDADGFGLGELFLAVLGDEVVFDPDELAVLVYPFEGVAAVAVLVDPAVGCAVVGEEHQTSVVAFGCQAEKVESRIVVEEEVLGVAGLGANDVRTLDWVAAEEDLKTTSLAINAR
jgi:hypothetical protein